MPEPQPSSSAPPSSTPVPLRVSWLMSAAVTPYRVPLLARLGADPSLDLTVFHGGSEAPEPYGEVAIGAGVRLASLRNLYWKDGRRVALQLGLNRFFRRPADVVIIQDITHNISTWLALIGSRLMGRRIVLFGYGYRPRGISRGWAEWLRDLGRRAFVWLAHSAATYTDEGKEAVAAMGLAPHRIVTVDNTLDTSYLTSLAEPARTEEAARRLGVEGRPTILFVGRLLAVKRIDLLLAAFDLVKEKVPEAALVVVGAGEESARVQPRPDVVVVGQVYDPPSLAPLFGLATALVIPGRIGLTCVHAFAYGVPVVTCDESLVEQSPEYGYIVHGENGLVVGDLAPSAVADAIVRLITDQSLREKLSRGAVDTARRLDMDNTAAAMSRAIHLAADDRQ